MLGRAGPRSRRRTLSAAHTGLAGRAEALGQFARWPYLHLPKPHQRWLKLFIGFAREGAGRSLAEWLAQSYAPETLKAWLDARGMGDAFAGSTTSPALHRGCKPWPSCRAASSRSHPVSICGRRRSTRSTPLFNWGTHHQFNQRLNHFIRYLAWRNTFFAIIFKERSLFIGQHSFCLWSNPNCPVALSINCKGPFTFVGFNNITFSKSSTCDYLQPIGKTCGTMIIS